jgi:hypothetical protein
MAGQLSQASRISDLIGRLVDPVGYITGVAANFVSCGYDPETSGIRIGTKGVGVAPNYKIEKPSYLHTLKIRRLSLETTVTVTPSQTFNGRNHREMVELDDLERHDNNWSMATMTFGELKELLSRLSRSQSIH